MSTAMWWASQVTQVAGTTNRSIVSSGQTFALVRIVLASSLCNFIPGVCLHTLGIEFAFGPRGSYAPDRKLSHGKQATVHQVVWYSAL